MLYSAVRCLDMEPNERDRPKAAASRRAFEVRSLRSMSSRFAVALGLMAM